MMDDKKVREKSRECHNHKPQPFPDTKRKRKQTKPNKRKSNKRTKSTKISSLFPKRGKNRFLFFGNIRKIFHNVVCWFFLPRVLSISFHQTTFWNIFLFFQGNRIWHFMQIVSQCQIVSGKNKYKKCHQHVICWNCPECAKHQFSADYILKYFLVFPRK